MLSLFSLTRCLGIECSLEGRKVGTSGGRGRGWGCPEKSEKKQSLGRTSSWPRHRSEIGERQVGRKQTWESDARTRRSLLLCVWGFPCWAKVVTQIPSFPTLLEGLWGRSVALVQRLNILRSWFRDTDNCTRSTELNKKGKFFSDKPCCVSPWRPWTTLCRETHCCMQLQEQPFRISGLPLHNTQF